MTLTDDLRDDLRKTTADSLKDITISLMDFYARTNNKPLKALYDGGVIDDRLIDDSLEQAVFAEARSYYDSVIAGNIMPDHLARPELLAYAICKRKFSDDEINRLQFDHGESVGDFIDRYGKQELIQSLRKELLNPPPAPDFGEYDPHPVCLSCGL